MAITLQSGQASGSISGQPESMAMPFKEHLAFWQQRKPLLDDIVYALPGKCIDELDSVLPRLHEVEPAQISSVGALKYCRALVQQLQHELDSGAGAVLIDRFPSERFSEQAHLQITALLASMMGTLMPQNRAGLLVRSLNDCQSDSSLATQIPVLGTTQRFHTDGSWHRKPPRYTGLYCIRNALPNVCSTELTSLVAAYDALRSQPKLLDTLCHVMPWDKRGEYGPYEDSIELNPVFESSEDRILARHCEASVRDGYTKLGRVIDSAVDKGLVQLSLAIQQQHAISLKLDPGQFLYLNNWQTVQAHSLTGDDMTAVSQCGHLVRVWNC